MNPDRENCSKVNLISCFSPDTKTMSLQRFGRPLPPNQIRFLCLPPAGVGPSIFRGLMSLETQQISICPVAMPGREGRALEPVPNTIASLAHQLARELSFIPENPYVIFGYSMGALVGFEIVRQWLNCNLPAPVHFYSLAGRAPQVEYKHRLHELDSKTIREEIEKLGGMPREIIENNEAMDIYEPILRADFKVCEEYRCESLIPLKCPIDALVSDRDPILSVEEMGAWSECTQNRFKLHTLKGQPHTLTGQTLLTTVESLIGQLMQTRQTHPM